MTPGTASGVIFLTLEDETGTANVVVWKKVYETFRKAVIAGRLVSVTGRIERGDDEGGAGSGQQQAIEVAERDDPGREPGAHPAGEAPVDPLKFRDEKRYIDRLKDARAKTGAQDAFKVGYGRVKGLAMTLAVMTRATLGHTGRALTADGVASALAGLFGGSATTTSGLVRPAPS